MPHDTALIATVAAGLGLHFSIADLRAGRRVAVPGALTLNPFVFAAAEWVGRRLTARPAALARATAVASAWVCVGLGGCARPPAPARQPREPAAALERAWGRLATVANVPTAPQAGNGDRVGLFDDGAGTVWGLPLAVGREDGAADAGAPRDSTLWGCAPAVLRGARVTDTLPARLGTIVGAMNAPTGYRGGTGRLEVVLRDAAGALHWARVRSDTLPGAPICGAYPPLRYYRLARGAASTAPG